MATKALVAPKPTAPPASSTALMTMIEKAVSDPAFDVAKMDALLRVKERWDAEEARKAFVSAMTAFKANPPDIFKNKKVDFETQKGRTNYKHASLDNVSIIIGTALAAHGLSHRWSVEQNDTLIKVTCILMHNAGHSESLSMKCAADQSGNKNSIQAIGSAVTYLERYSLLAITGMAVQDDDDGKAADKSAPIPGPKESKAKPKEPAAPTSGTDSFTIKLPFLYGNGDKIEVRGPLDHQKYRIDVPAAKTAKANFQDGDIAEIAWKIKDGVKWIASIDRKTSDSSGF